MKQYSILNSEKIKRIKETIKLFLDNNGEVSDERLAQMLSLQEIKSSSSTVGRDLTININKLFYQLNGFEKLTDEQIKIIEFIKNKRLENLQNAKRKGGKNSLHNSDYIKDDNNDKFQGSKKRIY